MTYVGHYYSEWPEIRRDRGLVKGEIFGKERNTKDRTFLLKEREPKTLYIQFASVPNLPDLTPNP